MSGILYVLSQASKLCNILAPWHVTCSIIFCIATHCTAHLEASCSMTTDTFKHLDFKSMLIKYHLPNCRERSPAEKRHLLQEPYCQLHREYDVIRRKASEEQGSPFD